MSLFFIQQYIVAKTSQFLTEIHYPNPNPALTILNSQLVTRDELTY